MRTVVVMSAGATRPSSIDSQSVTSAAPRVTASGIFGNAAAMAARFGASSTKSP